MSCLVTRHLASECTIAIQRRKLVSEAEFRKLQEAKQALDEREALRQERLQQRVTSQVQVQEDADGARSVAHSTAGSSSTSLASSTLDLDSRFCICPLCNESMKLSQLRFHRKKLCAHRKIMCPNFHNGCQQKFVQLNLLHQHLANECAAERLRDAMVASSAHRRGMYVTRWY
jgi:hypothetical protein